MARRKGRKRSGTMIDTTMMGGVTGRKSRGKKRGGKRRR